MKRMLPVLTVLLLGTACCGVSRPLVVESTTTIADASESGQNSVQRCQEGNADSCGEATRRFAQIKELAERLRSKAQDK